MSELFTFNALSEYRTHKDIKNALAGVQLKNLEEFLEWFYPDVRSSPRVVTTSRVLDVARINNDRRAAANDVLRLLPRICGPGINKSYGVAGINNLLIRKHEYDIIFAISPTAFKSSIAPSSKPNKYDEEKLNGVVGFLIAELGECDSKPRVYSVNLICALPTTDVRIGVRGGLLMGAYMYCIKKIPLQIGVPDQIVKEGFLELAGGYSNMSGLISYMRMGFDKSNERCLTPLSNLPMSVELTNLAYDTIIQRAAGLQTRRIPNEESGLYNIKKGNPNIHELGVCNNLLYKIEMLGYSDVINQAAELDSDERNLLRIVQNQADDPIDYLVNRRDTLLCKGGVCRKFLKFFGIGVGVTKRGKKGKNGQKNGQRKTRRLKTKKNKRLSK